ncbi:MAG TPA: c-type cytochrome [Pyrinomonadaceae bacterium]
MSLALLCAGSWFAVFSATVRPGSQRLPDGDALFLKNCASCHGKDGRAKTFKAKFNHARNLADPRWQAAISDEHVYESILHGKEKMPAFGKKLTADEVAALVTYVRMLKR